MIYATYVAYGNTARGTKKSHMWKSIPTIPNLIDTIGKKYEIAETAPGNAAKDCQ